MTAVASLASDELPRPVPTAPDAPQAPDAADLPLAPRATHEALVWTSVAQFLAVTVPFVRAALDVDDPVMVALVEDEWAHLEAALGDDAGRVHRVDMAVTGANPARLLPTWEAFVAEHPGRSVRGVGGPVWAGRRPEEVAEAHLHESLLTLSTPPDAPVRLLCTYDARVLPAPVLVEVLRHHPHVARPDGTRPSPGWTGLESALRLQPLDEPAGPVEELEFAAGRLSHVRRVAVQHAAAAGLDPQRTDDLSLAVSEVASNSVDHGGGGGVLRAWSDETVLVLEVRDRGRIADPLAGRRAPAPDQERGRGLWIANQLCDLVQIRATDDGTVVRLVTWL